MLFLKFEQKCFFLNCFFFTLFLIFYSKKFCMLQTFNNQSSFTATLKWPYQYYNMYYNIYVTVSFRFFEIQVATFDLISIRNNIKDIWKIYLNKKLLNNSCRLFWNVKLTFVERYSILWLKSLRYLRKPYTIINWSRITIYFKIL